MGAGEDIVFLERGERARGDRLRDKRELGRKEGDAPEDERVTRFGTSRGALGRGERALDEEEAAVREGRGRKTIEDWGVLLFFLPFASAVPVAVAGCLGGCGVFEGKAGDSGSGEAQRTMLTLMRLPLALPLVPVRAIPTSKGLYGLVRVRDLVALGEMARAMALRFPPVIPMRFIKSFSIAGMRIERSLRSFLLIAVFCIARVRSCNSQH